MKTLTVRQPHAEAIMAGVKDEEYRSWSTDHRGLLLIHAGKTVPASTDLYPGIESATLVYGAILGAVDVTDCRWDEANDCWAWTLANPRRLAEPVPYLGQRGLWDGPDLDGLI